MKKIDVKATVFAAVLIVLALWYYRVSRSPEEPNNTLFVFLIVGVYVFLVLSGVIRSINLHKAMQQGQRTTAPQVRTAFKPGQQAMATTKNAPKNMNIPVLHAQEKTAEDTVTFKDIAGYEKTKKSMMYLVECLANPETLEGAGAKLPAGVLLYGPPGTGKTLFARALANEAHVSFLSVSASEFIELYVGQGARNIRSLFEDARKSAPCIVFIDEIDAVGCQRTGTMNDERRQTINALLTEVGAVRNTGILTIAATNDVDSLDSALKRPGRFDRVVAIPLPDIDDRRAIIRYYFSKKKIAEDVSLENLALMTEGKSGSFIATVINEAALHAASEKRTIMNQKDLDAAMFQILMNGEEKPVTNKKDLRTIAYHEAGHAIALKLLTDSVVPSVTIIGSTSGAGGVTFNHAKEESVFSSKHEMETRIQVCYAGRAAEECLFGNKDDITTGASNDLKQASAMLKEYFNTFGMGGDLLNIAVFTGKATDEKSLEAAKTLATKLYGDTVALLKTNRGMLDAVAQALLEKKTLNDKELEKIIKAHTMVLE